MATASLHFCVRELGRVRGEDIGVLGAYGLLIRLLEIVQTRWILTAPRSTFHNQAPHRLN
jgi:hypothetical protein